MTNVNARPSDRQLFAAYDIVPNQAIITAQGEIIRRLMTVRHAERREEIENQRRQYLRRNPGAAIYRNEAANAEIEQNANRFLFFYDELVLEYTPTRNGSLETFYVDYNIDSARQMNEFLFMSKNGVAIHGDRASRFQRGSNRVDQRHRRNARPVIVRFNSNGEWFVRMVVVADRAIARGEEIIL